MSEHICLSCNMCCDGTLFGFVAMTEQERQHLGARVDVRPSEKGPALHQRCTQLGSDGACGCYSERPQACRDYNCNLLKRLESGAVDEDYARRVVAQAKFYRDQAEQTLLAYLPKEYIPKDSHNPRRLMSALHRARDETNAVPEHVYDYAALLYNMFLILTEHEFQKR